MKSFLGKLGVALKAGLCYFLAVKRHGLDATNERIDELTTQGKFWYDLITEIHGELKKG